MSALAQPGLGEIAALEHRTIPFDYLFEFPLTGKPETLVSKTVVVSAEGPFVAHAIGYGVVPATPVFRFGQSRKDVDKEIAREAQLEAAESGVTPDLVADRKVLIGAALARSGRVLPRITPPPGRPPVGGAITLPSRAQVFFQPQLPTISQLNLQFIIDSLAQRAVDRPVLEDSAQRPTAGAARRTTSGPALVEAVLRNGLRLNPEFADLVLMGLHEGKAPALSEEALEELFEAVSAPPENIQFKYALFDEGTGRAFQSDPILNTAGLGISDGSRPFRTLAQPITFATRTTIRMDVIEVSRFAGTLHVALHGYKLLGTAGTPTDVRRQMRRWRR